MNRIARYIVFLTFAATSSALAGPNARTAKLVSGTWDMSRRMRGLPVLMVIRQEGNMYPSFWCGRCDGGKFVIRGSEDALTDDLVVQSSGSFAAKITHAPPKPGMENLMPGGIWAMQRPVNVSLEFQKFSGWKIVPDRRGEGAGVAMEATFTGIFNAGGRSATVTGTTNFWLPAKVAQFDLRANVTIPAEQLGLSGDAARPLQVKVQLYSPASSDSPPSANELQKIDVSE